MTVPKALSWICVIGVSAFVIFFLSDGGKNDDETSRANSESARIAIHRVLSEHGRFSRKLKEEKSFTDQYWDGSGLVANFAQALYSIDLSGCPLEFRHAHNDYVAAWRELSHLKANNEGVNGMAKIYLTAGGSVLTYLEELEDSQLKLESTWRVLERMATDYEVDIY